MSSNPVTSIITKIKKGDKSPEPKPARPVRDKSPASIDLASQDSHQPMYRKREAKPGQVKEKREIRKRSNSPSAHQRKSRSSKRSNGTSKKDRSRSRSTSSSRANQTSGGNSKKKSKKQTKSKKKKKSKLSFWFCMSANTESLDPKKPKAPMTKAKPSIEKVPDSIVQEKLSLDTDKHGQDGIVEMPTKILATKHSRRKAGKRFSAPPSTEWTTIVTKAIVESPAEIPRPRSRTPTGGVRYRYDGTLERPYVYPGGLTFQSADKSRRFDESKYVDVTNSSFADTTLDRSRVESCEDYDEFDIRRKLYLRYDHSDHSPTESSFLQTKRYSMPADFIVGDRPENKDFIKQEVEIDQSCTNNATTDETHDNSGLYDSPYESDNDNEKNEVREETSEQRNSYYSKPIQNSDCIYMWHSCEDLQHCEEKYHSKDAINRICCHEKETDSECNTHNLTHSHNDGNERSNCDNERAKLGLSCPEEPANYDDVKDIGYSRRMSLPVELAYKNAGIESTELPVSPEGSQHRSNPFRRNAVRSSCMPGNKRFFLPPPPCYTPPKEEMEAALPLMSKEKYSCHRGSQTDLADDIIAGGDMQDRDFSLKRDLKHPQDATDLQQMNCFTDMRMSRPVKNYMQLMEVPQGQTLVRDATTTTKDTDHHNISSSVNSFQHNQYNKDSSSTHTTCKQTTFTSTPKPKRRSDLSGDEPKGNTIPKPVPRQRNRNIDSTSSSFSIPDTPTDNTQPAQLNSIHHSIDPKSNGVVSPVKKIPPVPKKRRSQMIESDFTYTDADIEKGLESCDEYNTSLSPCAIAEEVRNRDRRNVSPTPDSHRRDNVTHNCDVKPATHQVVSSSKLPTAETRVSIAAHSQTVTSPAYRRRLNSSLDSSIDGGCPNCKSVALSPSVDHIVNVFQKLAYDSDNDDNCNADDEMSIHNEELTLCKSASVQNLLRSRSIFDRSLAVTRKRRQRLRERKCQSQLLSSAELDHYDDVLSGNHLWRHQKSDSPGNRQNGAVTPSNTGEGELRLKPKPELWKLKYLWKHSYTDSGNDSDILSPTDTRVPAQNGEDVFNDPSTSPSPWVKRGPCDYRAETLDKTSWETRLRHKHVLRAARSIEHLYLAREEQVVKKPGLETSV